MKKFPAWRWLLRVFSIPAGFFLGAFVGHYICYLLLRSEGRGNSHNDMIQLAFVSFASGIGTAVVVGSVAWVMTKPTAPKAYWQEEPIQSPVPTRGKGP